MAAYSSKWTILNVSFAEKRSNLSMFFHETFSQGLRQTPNSRNCSHKEVQILRFPQLLTLVLL